MYSQTASPLPSGWLSCAELLLHSLRGLGVLGGIPSGKAGSLRGSGVCELWECRGLGGLELRWGLEGKLSHSGSRDGADTERQQGENTLRGVCQTCRQQPGRSHEGTQSQKHKHTHVQYVKPKTNMWASKERRIVLFKYSPLSSTILSFIFSSPLPPAVSSIPLEDINA